MYAVFETGGKQYTATAGDILFVEKLNVEPGEEITFDKVLAMGGEGETTFGAPYLDGAAVTAKVLKNAPKRIPSARRAIVSPIQR